MTRCSEPYPLFRKTATQFVLCNEKECLGVHLVSSLYKSTVGRERKFSRALCLAVVMLFIAISFQTAAAQESFTHSLGRFETTSMTQGIIIAAPHGTYDIRTDALAKDVARMLGAGYIVAHGFSSGTSRVNVNRPTEGAGRTCERERRTKRAGDVYDHYVRLIGKSRDGRQLKLYVEIHGHSSLPFPNRFEIATTGITIEEARQLKERFPAFLAQAKALYPAYPELEMRIEPIDKVYFGAGCNKKIGYISTRHMDRVLHMEIPRSARTPETLGATAALVNSIVRATMNLAEPDFGPGKKKTPEAGEKSAGSSAQ